MKFKFDKCLNKQIKPIKFSPFSWVDTEDLLIEAVDEIKKHLGECNLLSVDLEYHNLAKVFSNNP